MSAQGLSLRSLPLSRAPGVAIVLDRAVRDFRPC